METDMMRSMTYAAALWLLLVGTLGCGPGPVPSADATSADANEPLPPLDVIEDLALPPEDVAGDLVSADGDAQDVPEDTLSDAAHDLSENDASQDVVVDAALPDVTSPEDVFMPPACGDGQVDPGEACDEGELNSDDTPDACRLDCTLPICGDGVTDTGEICDDGNESETDACTSSCEPGLGLAQPGPGEMVFTELMVNPLTVNDPTGEWIEMLNTTDQALNLSGCLLHDEGTDVAALGADGSDWVVEPGAVFVFGFNADPQVNGGVAVDGLVTTMLLDNVVDEVILTCNDTTVDALAFDKASFPIMEGHALALDPSADSQTNDFPASWCAAEVPYGAGDYGSPGSPNPACPEQDVTIDLCVLTGELAMMAFVASPVTVTVEVVEVGVTNLSEGVDGDPSVVVQVGWGPAGVVPSADEWAFVDAAGDDAWTSDLGADGYVGSLVWDAEGAFEVAARASRDGGLSWTYCDSGVGSADGYQSAAAGSVEVVASPCAASPCGSAPESTCADDGLTLLSPTGDVICTPTSSDTVDCQWPIESISCAAEGLFCDAGVCQNLIPVAAEAGAVIATELLQNPSNGAQGAQWLELRNVSEAALNLAGCWISDGAGAGHAVAGNLVVSAGEHVTLAGTLDPSVNGGFDPDYSFGIDLDLSTNTGTFVLACDGVVIDDINLDLGGFTPQGVSIGLSPYKQSALGNDEPTSWCPSTTPFGDGDHGTPGALSLPCPADHLTIKTCHLETLPVAVTGAGVSLAFGVELAIDEKPEFVTVEARVEIGVGPAGGDPQSIDWTWAAASKDLDLPEMASLDEDSGTYKKTLRVAPEGAWSVLARASADDGKTWTFCDLDGSSNGFSLEQMGALTVEASPCWPDPCGAPQDGVCAADQLVNQMGEAMCALETDQAECTWPSELLEDCGAVGGLCEAGACTDLPPNPGPGDLIFSELNIIPNPDDAEWFELTNLTDQAVLMTGCTLTSGAAETLVFPSVPTPSLLVPASASVVFSRAGAVAPVETQFTYVGIALANETDILTLVCGEVTVDALAWGPSWPIVPFQPLQLSADSFDTNANDLPTAWCIQPPSPGAPNVVCP